MARTEYQEALDALREDVRGMGELVCDRVEDALAALEAGDEDLARTVVDGDDRVDRLYLELEADCVDLLALEQPVAGDLRFVVASFKILTDLERIADLATNLAQYALAADAGSLDLEIRTIGEQAVAMVRDAIAAYAAADPDACREIAVRDDEIDALCLNASDRVVRDMLAGDGGETTRWDVEHVVDDVSRTLLTIRDLERVADHAVNVAARTLYAVESDPELV